MKRGPFQTGKEQVIEIADKNTCPFFSDLKFPKKWLICYCVILVFTPKIIETGLKF